MNQLEHHKFWKDQCLILGTDLCKNLFFKRLYFFKKQNEKMHLMLLIDNYITGRSINTQMLLQMVACFNDN